MSTQRPTADYVLGDTDREHERLIRQAKILAPCTRRLFVDAGIRPGMRILDLGSGVGDVAMLAAKMVGASGAVVGLDRDIRALAKARARAAANSLSNLSFVETDLLRPDLDGEFDAIVGRFVLMFLPDAIAIVKALLPRLRPGGRVAFQEAHWDSFFALSKHLPLYSKCGEIMCEVLSRSGAEANMALKLYRGLKEVGFKSLEMRVETILLSSPETCSWLSEILQTVQPRFGELGIQADAIGNCESLQERLVTEQERTGSFLPFVGLACVHAEKPA